MWSLSYLHVTPGKALQDILDLGFSASEVRLELHRVMYAELRKLR